MNGIVLTAMNGLVALSYSFPTCWLELLPPENSGWIHRKAAALVKSLGHYYALLLCHSGTLVPLCLRCVA